MGLGDFVSGLWLAFASSGRICETAVDGSVDGDSQGYRDVVLTGIVRVCNMTLVVKMGD